jgi:hypothetical protein
MADFAPFIIPEIDAEMKKREQDGLIKGESPFKHGLKEDSCQSALGSQSSWLIRQWANARFATGRTISVPACFAALLDMLS